MKRNLVVIALLCLPGLLMAQAIKFEFSNIRFKTGSAVIEPATYPALDTLGQFLKRSGARVEVAGHTDNVGSKRKNQKLSQQRAQSVCLYLITKHRIAASQLAAKGYGDLMPLVPNLTEEYRAKNRRVEITVLSKIRTARLSYLQGSVFVRKQGITRYALAETGQVLTILDEVVTDSSSRAEITFDNGSRIRVNPGSDVVLDELAWEAGDQRAKVGLTVNTGKIYAKINRLAGQKEGFTLSTPTAVAGIRGTELVLEAKADLTALLSVWEGEVAWRGQTSGSLEKVVTAAQGGICRAGQFPEGPLALPRPPMPQSPAASDTLYYNPDKPKNIKFAWKNNPASITHLLIARDFDMRDIVADVITGGESYTLAPGKRDDAYYWMLTSISPEGLEGQPWPTRTLRLVRKVEKPRLKIMKPSMGENLKQRKLLLAGESEPAARVEVNGKEVLVSDEGTFSEQLLLNPGENVLVVRATDRAGNVSEISQKVFCSTVKKIEVAAGAGGVKLMGGAVDLSDIGYLGGVKLGYNFNQSWGVGVFGSYGEVKCILVDWYPEGPNYKTTVIPGGAWLRYYLLTDYKVLPYAFMEAGVVSWQNKRLEAELTNGISPFGGVGAGVKFALSDYVSIYVEGSGAYMMTDTVSVGDMDENNMMARGGAGVSVGF
jgi:ferric-dicitrate binding protein FerR (iron transport regulator)